MLLTKLNFSLPDSSFNDEKLSSPLHLMWQYPNSKPPFLTIGFNEEICDLGFIPENENFRLSPYIQPNKYKVNIESNQRIRIEVITVAENGKSNSLLLEISWNGRWANDSSEMEKNLVVKVM